MELPFTERPAEIIRAVHREEDPALVDAVGQLRQPPLSTMERIPIEENLVLAPPGAEWFADVFLDPS